MTRTAARVIFVYLRILLYVENLLKELFDLSHTAAREYLEKFGYPWEALTGLKSYIMRFGATLDSREYVEVNHGIWAHKSAKIAPSASIAAPCIIGENTEVRHCAYIRGSAIIGKNCVIGNSTEIKNSILFDGVQVPHFNYVGDSILGFRAHFGAGVITSNIKCDKSSISVGGVNTGLRKLGAIVGDCVEVGCNSVLNTGTVIGRNSVVYPLSFVRGVIPADSIFKRGEIIKRE